MPLALLAASPAAAQPPRELCGDRPGLNAAACIVDEGRLQLETSLSWSRDGDGTGREDVFLIGDTLLRYGLDERTEIQLGATAYGRVKQRGAAGRDGIGDVTIALRRNFLSPDGSGTSAGLQLDVTLPTGSGALTQGDWSASLVLPVGFELTPSISAGFSPQIAAAADADGDGRHLAYGGVAGIALALPGGLEALLDLSMIRDDDPDEQATELLGGVALAWQTSADSQLDIGAVAGLNGESPDLQLYVGVVKRF